MGLKDAWPNWGSSGTKPSDGKDYNGGDNPLAEHFDHLWYHLRSTFSDIETKLQDIKDNKADDPHNNNAHSKIFAVDGDAQPPQTHDNGAHSKTFAVDGDAQPPQSHDNGAHSKTFAVDGDAQPPHDHDNSAHSKTFAVDGDAQPPESHGDNAHTENYLTSLDRTKEFDVYDLFISDTFGEFGRGSIKFRDDQNNVVTRIEHQASPSDEYLKFYGDRFVLNNSTRIAGSLIFGNTPGYEIEQNNGNLVFRNDQNVRIARLDSDGNLEVRGSITENVTF